MRFLNTIVLFSDQCPLNEVISMEIDFVKQIKANPCGVCLIDLEDYFVPEEERGKKFRPKKKPKKKKEKPTVSVFSIAH